MSSKIPTVGIVTWTTTQSNVKDAHIDFGLTTAYGMTAPVDLTEKDYRTLLLGMKTSKTYHYRVVAKDDAGNECSSPDATLMTGALANGLGEDQGRHQGRVEAGRRLPHPRSVRPERGRLGGAGLYPRRATESTSGGTHRAATSPAPA